MYNVHLMLIMDMWAKDLLVTTNSHMASLIEVPLAVRSARLTCNKKRLLINIPLSASKFASYFGNFKSKFSKFS